MGGRTGTVAAEVDLDALCAELGPPLYRLALARTGKPEDAEDLVQEALLKYLKARQRHEIEQPLHWTLKVVANAVKRRGRHQWRWQQLEDATSQLDASPDVEGLAQADLCNAAVALGQLRSRDRAHVTIIDLDNWSSADLARILGTSESGARMRVLRSREALALAYMRSAVGFDPQSSECTRAGALIPKACAGTLESRRTDDLEQHLAACPSCSQARDDLDQLLKDALTGLLPIPSTLRSRLHARLTAALRRDDQARRRLGWWAWLLWRPRRERSQRWRLALLLLLLLTVVLVTPHGPLQMPIRFEVASAHTDAPAVSAVREPMPMPSVSPPPPAPTSSPAAPPAVASTAECRAAWAGAYAYLDRGEVYLCTVPGDAPQRLTFSGGRVDYYWWSPNGEWLAFKTAPGGSTMGSVSILSMASRQVISILALQATFFSFSPDSSSWVVVAPIINSTGYQGQPGFGSFRAAVGRLGSRNAAASFTVAGVPGNAQPWPGNYAELPDLPDVSADEPWGVYWLSDAIYLDQGGGGQMTHTFTASGDSGDPWTMESANLTLQNRLWGIGSASAFALNPMSGDPSLYLSSGGRKTVIDQPPLAGPAETLSVTPNGQTALITDTMLYPCRQDDYLITAASVVTQLDSDCYSSLARWQP